MRGRGPNLYQTGSAQCCKPGGRCAGDQQMDGFEDWSFMTTHNWDEPSAGVWRLEVRNGHSACEYS